MIKPWSRIEPTVVTKIDRRTIVIKSFEQPHRSEPKVFATLGAEKERAAGVVALTPDKRVIVTRQFRPGPEMVMDELPGGGVEPGEDPQAGAIRELKEETGYVPGKVIPLGECTHDAYMNGIWYYYLALDCVLSPDGQQLDHEEEIEVDLISIEQYIENAKTGKMTDPQAVLMAYEHLKRLQEE